MDTVMQATDELNIQLDLLALFQVPAADFGSIPRGTALSSVILMTSGRNQH